MARAAAKKTVRGTIDRETIVKTALALLARHGAEGVTTRQLAEALGIAGPSLYWHFRDMRELFDHMAEAMLAEAQPVPDPLVHEPDWRVWLEKAAHAYRRAATSRRDAATILAGARPTGTHPTLNYPQMIARLQREGFADRQAAYVVWSLGRFALGWSVSEQASEGARRPALSDTGFAFGLRALLSGFESLKGG